MKNDDEVLRSNEPIHCHPDNRSGSVCGCSCRHSQSRCGWGLLFLLQQFSGKLDDGVFAASEVGIGLLDVVVGLDAKLG